MDGQPPLSLRHTCLRVMATTLSLPPTTDAASLSAAIASLPPELRSELLQLLARWQLLGDAACTALCCSCFLPSATSLSLSGCSLLSANTLRSQLFATQLPRLVTLNLRAVLPLTDSLLEGILRLCPALRQLDVSRCLQLTDAGVAAVGAHCAGSLAGSGGPLGGGCSGEPPAALSPGAGCSADTGLGVSAAAASAGGLQSLSVAGCWQIGCIQPLCSCICLTSLSLDGCWQLQSSSVRQVLGCLPNLEALSLSGCFQLGSSVLVSKAGAPGDDPDREAAAFGDLSSPHNPGLPLEGVRLHRLRSLDVGGSAVCNDLLYWVALYCCARLQKLVVAGCKAIDGLGIGAVLAAKRRLLLLQLPHDQAPTTPAAGTQPGANAQQPCRLELLPLLELSAGGLARWAPAAAGTDAEGGLLEWWQEQQAVYERSCGPLCLHLSSEHPPIPLELAPGRAAHAVQQAASRWDQAGADSAIPWPPESAADVLLCLGSEGLGQLESLDMGQGGERGGAVGTAAAATIAQHCRRLRRLRLHGCQVSDAQVGEIAMLPCLTQLDVSGCAGTKTAAPGSRFQRHPAKRRQQGGVSDGSLALLAKRSTLPSPSPPRQLPGSQPPLPTALLEALQAVPPVIAGPGSRAAQRAQQPPGDVVPPPPEPLQALNAGGLLITDASLQGLEGLASLQLRGCKRVSDTGILHCLLASPQLTRLDLGGCSQLSAGALGCSVAAGARGGQDQQRARQAASSLPPPVFPAAVSSLAHAIPKRLALPKQAACAEVLAWLAGRCRPPGRRPDSACGVPSGSGSNGENRGGAAVGGLPAPASWDLDRGLGVVLGCSPLQKLELSCSGWQAAAALNSSGAGCADGIAVSAAHVAALAAACPQLLSLQLLSAGGLGGGWVAGLVANCRLLSRLSVTECGQLSDADVALLARIPALLHLNLSGCSRVGDGGLQEFAAAFQAPPPLQQTRAAVRGLHARADSAQGGPQAPVATARVSALALLGGSGSSMEDAGRAGTVEGRRCFLQTLKLDGCGGVSDAGVAAMLAIAPHLETLSLRRLRGVTDGGAAAALEHCANLRSLLLGGSGVRGGFLVAAGGMPCDGGAVGWPVDQEGPGRSVVCAGLGVLELSQGVHHSRVQGAAVLLQLRRACAHLVVTFA